MLFGKIRLLPVTIFAAMLLFGIKVGDIWQGVMLTSSEAVAKEDKKEQKPAEEAAAESGADAGGQDGSQETAGGEGLIDKDPSLLTKSELELLAELTKRRNEIEARAREVEMRAKLLEVSEKRVEERINELRKLEKTIRDLLKENDQIEEKQLKSLVKVYESMKPKNAARIFNSLDMKILMTVAQRMKESKMAAVLAAMDSEKARELTVKLATQRELPTVAELMNSADGGKKKKP